MNPHTRLGRIAGAFAVLSLVVPAGTALAAPPDGMETTGEDYSDLVVLLRAEDGTPVLKKFDVPVLDEETGLPTGETEPTYCVQPVSYDARPGVTVSTSPVDGREVYLVPLQGDWLPDLPDPLPVAELEACDPQPAYGMFVNEVELERLNMARTADRVMDQKTGDVEAKILAADVIDLDPAGRIRLDGTAIDAAPEHAAIYQSIMRFGILPGWNTSAAEWTDVGPAPDPAHPEYNSQFDRWELAAAAVGTAASKGVPITIDTVEYYNQVIGFPELDDQKVPLPSPWGLEFIQSADPDPADAIEPTRWYLDYADFTYNRSQTYPGSVTWLDIQDLEWNVSRITNAVPFTNPGLTNTTLTGVQAFQQMADDTRAVILFLHEFEVQLPGFYMDPVGVDTRAAQLAAVTEPAVDLGVLPAEVFQTEPFTINASVWNPHEVATGDEGEVLGGTDIPDAQVRITFDAAEALTSDMLSVTTGDPAAPIPFTAVDGNLVGYWPDAAYLLEAGTFDPFDLNVTIAEGAPTGAFTVTLELFDGTGTRATDVATVQVNPNLARVLYGAEVSALATQGGYLEMPLRVYAPAAGEQTLSLRVIGPTGVDVPPLAVGNVQVYGVVYDDMGVPVGMGSMPFTLDGADLVGTWSIPAAEGYNDVMWYVQFAEGGPVGTYALIPGLVGGNTLDSVLVIVSAPEDHTTSGGGGGEPDTKPPVVHVKVDESVDPTLDDSAAFLLTTEEVEEGLRYSCRLTKDSLVGAWVDCTDGAEGRIAYDGLEPGDYVFTGRAIDAAGNISLLESVSWTVEPPVVDTTPPVATMVPQGTPGADASFVLGTQEAEDGLTYLCRLTVDNVAGAWEECTTDAEGVVSFTGLAPASYVLAVKVLDEAGNASDVVTYSWTVAKPVPGQPETMISNGPGPEGWVFAKTARFALGSDMEGATFQYRLNAGEWKACDAECDVDGFVQGRNKVRFRAMLGDEVDQTPAIRTVYMPHKATGLKRSDGWKVRTAAKHMFGKHVVTKKKGETLRNRYRSIERIALVAATGKAQGKVHVYVNRKRVATVNLADYGRKADRLIEVKSFKTPRRGVVKVVVASKGKPVKIDGIGVIR